MYILTQDNNNLINMNQVASIYIQKVYRQYNQPDTWWEIRAMYSALSNEDVLWDTIAKFNDDIDCQVAFNNLVNDILTLDKKFISFKK